MRGKRRKIVKPCLPTGRLLYCCAVFGAVFLFNFAQCRAEDVTVDIALAHQMHNDEQVEVQGIVTVLPGIIYSQSFYIEDSTGGIQIYDDSKDFPELNLGDEIKVKGLISLGGDRIKISQSTDIEIISHNIPMEPTKLEISGISERYVGCYVEVNGSVKDVGDFLIQDDANLSTITLYITSLSAINKPKMKTGDKIKAVGIVSLSEGRYKLILTKQEDIQILSSGSSTTVLLGSGNNIGEARNNADGQKVTVSGVVTVLPNVLSSQYFYIQDETSGIQIFCSKKDFPDLKVGDRIKVTGELSSVANERRLKIDGSGDIEVQGSGNTVAPIEIKIADVGEKYEGEYVKVQGTVVETSGDNFILEEKASQARVKVSIRDLTEINKPKMRKGDNVEVAGIVSQYKDEYRILPFKQEDVKILTSNQLPMAGVNEIVTLLFSFVIYYFLWILFQKTKKKHFNLQPRLPRHFRVAISWHFLVISAQAKQLSLRVLPLRWV